MLLSGCIAEAIADAEAAGGYIVVQVVEVLDDAVAPGCLGLPSHCAIK